MTQSTAEFVNTMEKATRKELEYIYSMELDHDEPIQVCTGEWRMSEDPDIYYFWKDPDFEDS
jgi:hypothetical protein